MGGSTRRHTGFRYANGSETATLFASDRRPPNPYLKLALLGSLGARLLAITLPSLRQLLGIGSISLVDAIVMAGSAAAPLLVNELTKGGAGPAMRPKAGKVAKDPARPG